MASLTFQPFTCAVPLAGNPFPTPWGQLPIVFWISSWLFPSWILLRMSGSGLGTTSLCSHSITPSLWHPTPFSSTLTLHLGPLFPIHCAYSMIQLPVCSTCLLFAKQRVGHDWATEQQEAPWGRGLWLVLPCFGAQTKQCLAYSKHSLAAGKHVKMGIWILSVLHL